MSMHDIEFDISGLIGKTDIATVIAFSNTASRALFISPKVKRLWLRALREQEVSPSTIYIRLYVSGVFLLLKDLLSESIRVTLDIEFPGHEKQIKDQLLHLIGHEHGDFETHQIQFGHIGISSRAHHKAISMWRGVSKPELKATVAMLLSVSKKK